MNLKLLPLISSLLLLAPGLAAAQSLSIIDTTSTSATPDGVVNVGEYVGFSTGINSGFGDQIGETSELHIDSDSVGNLHLGLIDGATSLTDFMVIYIDSVPGGFANTESFTDSGDLHRQAASGFNGTDRTSLFFALGFEADYAIVVNPFFAGLWELQGGVPHIFVADVGSGLGPDWELGLSLADIGLQTGDSFDYVATLINPASQFRADEYHGLSPFPIGIWGPGSSVFLFDDSYAKFTTAPLVVDDLGAGDLVINEIMAAPSAVGEGAGTWFEVLNLSGSSVDLNGLIVSDDGGESFTVSSTLFVSAGARVVFGVNDDVGLNGGAAVDYDWGSSADFDLDNGEDEIVLSNSTIVIDRVAYDATYPLASGVSLNLSSLAADASSNDSAGNWCGSTTPFGSGDLGTPAQDNIQCINLDADGDGFLVGVDCDDSDEFTYPGAAFNDSVTDCMTDADQDGWGDLTPVAGVTPGTDCNDGSALTYPGATEFCDGVDTDCDGLFDEVGSGGATDSIFWFVDSDGDGFGNAVSVIEACDPPAANYVTNGSDCDDNDQFTFPGAAYNESPDACLTDRDLDGWGSIPSGGADCDDTVDTTNPTASEFCDDVDHNCDGQFYDNAIDALTWYADADGDTFGDAGSPFLACSQPADYVANDTDCDDTNGFTFPGAATNESDPTLCMSDVDGDGYGDALPPNGVAAGTDCNDGVGGINPGADEVCDGVDNDCKNGVDTGASDALTFYSDSDGDTFGDVSTTQVACTAPTDYVADNTDCDDSDAFTYPGSAENDSVTDCMTDADGDGYGASTPANGVVAGSDCNDDAAAINIAASEVCDTVDNDCDGGVDVGASDALTFYLDSDGDTFGDVSTTQVACTAPTDYVSNSSDCDDSDSDTFPGSAENDDASACMTDADGDGYGASTPANGVVSGSDCNDGAAAINIAASEVCDMVDNDCDGGVDIGATDASTWYADTDGDSYGDASSTVDACAQPMDYVADNTDCDDSDAFTYPGVATNESDASACMTDADGDGYGASVPATGVTAGTDCADDAMAVNPAADEICDMVDNDCDGTVDQGASDEPMWYSDADQDGFGDADTGQAACVQPEGTVADMTDCDDDDALTYPGVASKEDDSTACMTDADGDGWGDASPRAEVSPGSDCGDDDAEISPEGTEVCDDVDNNCDGIVDNDASDALTWYADADGDGYGDASSSITACTPDGDHVAGGTDCNDANADIYPGAPELEDGIDNDCDGADETVDSDGDGLTDLEESVLGTNPDDADSDGDGTSDGDEVDAGRDPLKVDGGSRSVGGGADGCSMAGTRGSATGPWMWLFLVGVLVRRRRKA